MPLPQFSRWYEDFQNFKSQFLAIIDQNLNDTQKLFYLKAVFNGEAKSNETWEDTFHSMFAALESRYEDKRIVVDALINTLLNLEKINESASQLKHLLDKIIRNLR
ncbi:integrase catalytic domain-containing protein [Nephila pilipes]|uniref:Integrase catalytic domain-containing protein n=1 Tax=Nephila pilipes TaxID=299642 RepID=A0A8X6PEE6_NEPPI|nr:integrase catalytic domain-containing protein [Nephila pilipes]